MTTESSFNVAGTRLVRFPLSVRENSAVPAGAGRRSPRGKHDQPHGPDDGVDQLQNFTPSRSAVMMRPTSARWSIGMGPAGMLIAPSLKMTLMGSAGSNTVGLPSAA